MPRQALIWLVLAGAAGISVLSLQGSTAAPGALTIKAGRDDVVVSVGGVGRIVEARGSTDIAIPGSSTTASGSASGSGTAPADAVFPRTSGRVLRFLVKPGQHVSAGQPLALIDDGGSASAAVKQSQNDLSAALLELQQKQTSDPAKGLPPTPAELAAAGSAVTAARQRLALLLGPPRRADLSAAQLDLERALADLETLRGGRPAGRAEAIRLARQNVGVARTRLNRLLAPPDAGDVSAADADVKKAAADLAALLNPPPAPLPEAVKAVESGLSAAKNRIAKLKGAPDPVVVSTAQMELAKAEADLAVLQKTPAPPLPEALAAAQQAVTTAQVNLADAQAVLPKDPVAVSAAQLEVSRALADLAALQQPAAGPLAQELTAVQAAIDNAQLKLGKAQGPPDSADVNAAQLELDKALADLATLKRPAPAPLPKAIAAARQALAAARLKRSKLGLPNPADVAAARLELQRALADLHTLKAGPTPAALAAARQAVASSRAKLAQLKGRPLRADVTAARLEIRKAEAELGVLRARGGPSTPIDINLAQLKVEAARARLASARVANRLRTVRAPSAGTVTALSTVPGAPVDSSTPIATVADLDHLAVMVGLSEFDAAPVKQGMQAIVKVDALGGKPFQGKVLFTALTGVDTSGVVTFPVLVGLTRSTGLKPGMNVSVRIVVAQRPNVVEVPLEAVSQEVGEPPTVMVVNASGKELLRKVKLGLANNKVVEIVKGLRVGERVVLAEGGQAGD